MKMTCKSDCNHQLQNVYLIISSQSAECPWCYLYTTPIHARAHVRTHTPSESYAQTDKQIQAIGLNLRHINGISPGCSQNKYILEWQCGPCTFKNGYNQNATWLIDNVTFSQKAQKVWGKLLYWKFCSLSSYFIHWLKHNIVGQTVV